MQSHALIAAIAASLFLTTPTQASETGSGYSVGLLPNPESGAVLALSDGDLVTFDGASVDRWNADGSFAENVFTLPGVFFGGCFAISPDESTALVGESSNGDLYRVDLVNGGGAYLTTLVFNYAATFETDTTAIVSAATCGFGCGNDLARVDLSTGDVTFLVNVAGASGGVAVGADGDLYYGTASGDFPAPLGSTEILRFDAADLTGSELLSEADAQVVGSGFNGAFSLVLDPVHEVLYLAENNFGTGLNRVVRIPAATGVGSVVYEGDPFDFTSQLQFFSPTGDGFFFPYQPDGSGAVTAINGEGRVELTPSRPQLTASGAGVGGTGPFELQLDGAPELGLAVLGVGPQSLFATTETAYLSAGLPLLHTGMQLGSIRVLPLVIEIDANGAASVGPFTNDGALTGNLVFQALVFSGERSLLGSSQGLLF